MKDKSGFTTEQLLAFSLKKAEAIINKSSESIAIIGLSCNFPGARNITAFWELLHQGKDGIQEVPASRWDVNAYYDMNPDAPGKMISRKGGFIQSIDQFDASFFNISPREAEYLDPQQRLLLEQTWQALEHAGIAATSLKDSQTGVFIGIATQDYHDLMTRYGDSKDINAYMGTGSAFSTATGRISYVFGLQGPNMAIETACSSSLVALHEACKSLQRGECHLAITGGVNAILSPELSIDFSKAGMLAPDGYCKTFDAAADGYVRGEGCGIVVLKRLSDAQRDNDTVLAVIKASGVNQDGASSGLTVPNGEAQEKLLRKVLAEAKLKPNDIDYVECHGTGTSLGDPIEVHALGVVYGEGREQTHPLKLGSVKTNIGHLEAAAGVAGLIKTVLALQHHELPKHLHFNHLNPHIELNFPAEIVTESQTWEGGDRLRHAAVSAFGFSGTNAHVILEEAPKPLPRDEEIVLPQEQIFILSAKTKKSLEEVIKSYINYFEHSTESIEDICYSASIGRSHFYYRVALLVKNKEDLLCQLKSNELKITETSIVDELIQSCDLNLMTCEYLSGKYIDWDDYYQPYLKALCKVSLPTYCFDTQHHWLDIKKLKRWPYGDVIHELLGAQLPGHSNDIRFMNQLDLNDIDYLKDHCIYHHVIFPGAGFIESALSGGVCVLGEGPLILKDVLLVAPLAIESITEYELDLKLSDDGFYKGSIYARHHSEWVHHADFKLEGLSAPHQEVIDLAQLKANRDAISIDSLYQHFSELGLEYGKSFQSIQEAYVQQDKVLVAIKNDAVTTKGYYFHPALLDGVFQSIALLSKKQSITYIPSALSFMTWYQKAQGQIWADVTLLRQDAHSLTADIKITDENGILIAKLDGFTARAITKQALEKMIVNKASIGCYIELYDSYVLPEPTLAQEDLHGEHIVFIYEENFDALVVKAKKLLNNKPASFTLITNKAFAITKEAINPNHTKALGFWKSYYQEAGFPCYIIDRQDQEDLNPILALIRKGDMPETQLIIREKELYVPRLVSQEVYAKRHHELLTPAVNMYLESGTGIDTLYWATRDLTQLEEDELKIKVIATALNFRDVLKAIHLYPGEAGDFGYECVGVVLEVGTGVSEFTAGDKVIAMGQGLLSAEAIVKAVQTLRLPKNLNPAQGASTPIVFLTADYALNQLAKITKGQKVLIHAAAGGVGLAAIEFARLKGAEVYVTASLLKQAYLKEQGIKHIYDSRNTAFSAQINKDTKGKGVDVVLNSLTGEGFIEASLKCLKEGGVFLEIGKINIYSLEQMDKVRPDVCYHLIEIDRLMQAESEHIKQALQVILDLLEKGRLNPLPVTEYPVTQTIQAFQYLQQAKQVGKVVVSQPITFMYKPEGTYLITGGSGGLGLELAKHLISKGAKHLALISRSKTSDALQAWIKEQAENGITITHYSADVSDKKAIKLIFDAIANTKYPLKGIFHTAGLIKDGLLKDLNEADFEAVFAPKIQGCSNLDLLSQNLNLDCFVLFSSIASLLGNTGQSNYTAANAFMDGLAHKRHQHGLSGISINWGPFAKVGIAVNLETIHRGQGMHPLDARQAFEVLDTLLTNSKAQVGIMAVDWNKVSVQNNRYLEYLVPIKVKLQGGWLRSFEAIPLGDRALILQGKIRSLLADVLNIADPDIIDINKNFVELGMDSLMMMEFNNKIQKELGNSITIQIKEIFDNSSVVKLTQLLMSRIKLGTKDEAVNIDAAFTLIKAPKQPIIIATEGQKRLVYLSDLYPESYNLGVVFKINGLLDFDILSDAINHVIAVNSIYKINFINVKNELYQVVDEKKDIQLTRFTSSINNDLSQLKQLIYLPYDLYQDNLIRFALLLDQSSNHSFFVIACHHTISDLVTLQLLMNQLFDFYSQLSETKHLHGNYFESFDYFDYSVSCIAYFQSPNYQKIRDYWLDKFKGHSKPTTFLPDISNPSDQFSIKTMNYNLTEELSLLIVDSSRALNSTVFSIVYASFIVFVYKHTQAQDIAIGLASHGRQNNELNEIHGFFTKTLPIRLQIDRNMACIDFLFSINAMNQKDLDHQPLNLIDLLNNLKKSIGSDAIDLFRVLFNFNSVTLTPTNYKVDLLFSEEGLANYDLLFSWHQTDQKTLSLEIKYNEFNYTIEYIETLFRQYTTLIKSFIHDSNQTLEDISLINDKEELILNEMAHGSNNPSLFDITFVTYFEQHIQDYANLIAVIDNDTEVSYAELDARSSQISYYLRDHSIGKGSIVCILQRRSSWLVMSILGVLKSGAAFVLIDPTQPLNRINYIISDSHANAILTQQSESSIIDITKNIILEDCFKYNSSDRDILVSPGLDDTAYLCYTSGSTGKPKGVVVTHRALMNLAHYCQIFFSLKPGIVCGHYSSVTFDAIIVDIFPAFIGGSTLIVIPEKIKTDFVTLCQFLDDKKIDFIFLPTSVYKLVMDYCFVHYKTIVIGGERLDNFNIINYKLVNGYGPTENTVFSTFKTLHQNEKITIGKPIDNVQTYIVDDKMRLVPIGVPGELILGGGNLANGYLNLPEKTKESFVDNVIEHSGKLYKTGDICRWLPSGDIDYIGRNDFQVKIRGIRIELDEINMNLQSYPEIKIAISLVNEKKEKQIISYVQPQQGSNSKIYDSTSPAHKDWLQKIYSNLKATLPSYMIPSHIEILKTIPLTPNGKIDRNALESMELTLSRLSNYEPPTSIVEKELVRIWSDILQVESIGILDNFFELGGHSLNIAELKSRVNAKFSCKLTVPSLYLNPSVKQQSQLLQSDNLFFQDTLLIPLDVENDKNPIFFIHPISGEISCYFNLAKELGEKYSVYALQSEALVYKKYTQTIEEMAASYIKAIQSVQTKGTYHLLGWSMGGIIAYEMGYQLALMGQNSKIVMLDSYLPNYMVSNNPNISDKKFNDRILTGLFINDIKGHIDEKRAVKLDLFVDFSLDKFYANFQRYLIDNDFTDQERVDMMELLQIYISNQKAINNFKPSTSSNLVLLVHCKQGSSVFQVSDSNTVREYWLNYVPADSFRLIESDSTHLSVLKTKGLKDILGGFYG